MSHNVSDLPSLSVTIVVYNSSLPLLEKTLRSLSVAAQNVAGSLVASLQVTIVDNGSSMEYQSGLEGLQIEGLEYSLLNLPDNLGFGAGHNRGLAHGQGGYHLVLNPDVEVAPDALSAAILLLNADSATVLVSPHSLGPNGQQEFLCKRYPSVLVLALRAFLPGVGRRFFATLLKRYEMSDVCGVDKNVQVPLVSGCFMLVRRDPLVQIGGFDEDYFLYFEDFDLSLRLGKLGALTYAPSVRILHHGGYAASKGWRHLRMFTSSGIRFFRQHGWRWI